MKSHEKGMRAVQVTLPDGARKNFVTKGTFMLDRIRLIDWHERHLNRPHVENSGERKGWRATDTAYFPGGGPRSQAIPELGGSRVQIQKRKFSWEPNGITPTSTERNPQKHWVTLLRSTS